MSPMLYPTINVDYHEWHVTADHWIKGAWVLALSSRRPPWLCSGCGAVIFVLCCRSVLWSLVDTLFLCGLLLQTNIINSWWIASMIAITHGSGDWFLCWRTSCHRVGKCDYGSITVLTIHASRFLEKARYWMMFSSQCNYLIGTAIRVVTFRRN